MYISFFFSFNIIFFDFTKKKIHFYFHWSSYFIKIMSLLLKFRWFKSAFLLSFTAIVAIHCCWYLHCILLFLTMSGVVHWFDVFTFLVYSLWLFKFIYFIYFGYNCSGYLFILMKFIWFEFLSFLLNLYSFNSFTVNVCLTVHCIHYV